MKTKKEALMSRRTAVVLACLTLAAPARAATTRVTSISGLRSAIAAAQPGDTVVLADGSYSNSSAISVARAGTSSARITIAAETIGGATISGTAGFMLDSGASYVTIRGFRFTHSGGGMKVAAGTNNCLITRNYFTIPGTGSYLRVAGTDNEVSYNSFQNKTESGAFIVLDEDNITWRPYVHHNYLRNHTYDGANGGEGIQVFSVLPRVEYNLFEEIHVHGEYISIKESSGSQGGFYRYNTFRNLTNGDLSFRYCRNDLVEGNFFINTPGLRVYGKNHTIRNNYVEGGRIMLGDGSTTGTYVGIDNLELSYNTLVNARILGSLRADTGIAPNNVRITNNIIVADGGVAMDEPHKFTNVSYAGNILWGTADAGAMPSSGYTRVDPQLVRNGNGILHLSATSPAIDAAVGSYAIADDLDGQPRSGAKDVGADEVSSATATRRALSPSDVGPTAGTSPTPTPTPRATPTPAPRATPTPTPAATPTPCATCGLSGYYKIIARHSGKAMVVQSASTTNGANVFQWTYGGSNTNDEWELRAIDSGYYRVINRNSGKDLSVSGASTANSADIVQWSYTSAAPANDEWQPVSLGNGYYRIVARHSGKVVNVAGASTADGANIDQYAWANVNQQQFQLISVP
jgi:poly(beta-D-mannuronate) lyase